MLGIEMLDWVAIGLYLALTIAGGIWAASKVKDATDFFMAGRRFGKPFMIFFAFGAGTSGNDAVGVSSKTYTNGMSGIWYQWLWLFCTPFYWLIAPIMRRMRCITTGDYFEARYDQNVAALYTFVGVAQLTINIGIIQLGAGSMIEGISNGAIQKEWAILAMTIMFVAYGVAGGLAAAIITDFIQGILTVILSFILIPFALNAVGGFKGLHEGIQDEAMFSLVAPGEINLFWIFMLGFNSLIGIVTQPHIMGVCAAGRTEMDGRVGFAAGNLIKRLCTVAWMIVGLCAVVMYMDTPDLPDNFGDYAYGQAAADLLPQVSAGLVGLFIAALIASVMSSCDAFMVSSSGLFTQNIYKRFVKPDGDDKHYVTVGRIAALAIVVCGVTFAFVVDDVPSGLMLFFKLQGLMGAAFWLGLFWRRTTVAGAWAATLTAFGVLVATNTGIFHDWAASNLPEMMVLDGKFRDSWQILSYLVGGFSAGIIVSLRTKRVDESKLDKVYRALRTPVDAAEEQHLGPFEIPEGVTVPEPRKLINHPDLEIPMPTALGMGGFAGLWVCVGLLIGFVFWMATWGT